MKFPRRAWDPNLYAQAVLAEFACTDWIKTVHLKPPPSDHDELAGEIVGLLALAHQYRQERLNEIFGQAQDLSLYWANILMATPVSRPATWDLITVAITIGQMVGMHFKLKFGRPRPAQFYPGIMPPILTPAHPSYPNNHALQSLLIARFVGLAAPSLQGPLDVLAERIGKNREIAGLHFASDREASMDIAVQIAPIIEKGNLFAEILNEAREEWQGVSSVPIHYRRG
jgi:hypothetical protein